MNKSLVVIISSPSGGGKSVIVSKLIKKIPNSTRLITTTTREPRKKEKDKKDYFFTTQDQFKKMIKDGEFVEYNYYAGDYYGTEKNKLKKILDKFRVIFLTIDTNGKQAFDEQKIPNLSIFLTPDKIENLSERILRRGGTNEKHLKMRLENAKKELKQAEKYDKQVINYEGKMDETVEKILTIINHNLEALDKKADLS